MVKLQLCGQIGLLEIARHKLGAKSDNKRQVKQRRNCMVQDFCKTTHQPRNNYKRMTSHVTRVGGGVNSEALSEREVAKIF